MAKVILFILSAVIVFALVTNKKQSIQQELSYTLPHVSNPGALFWEPRIFFPAVEKATTKQSQLPEKHFAAILPHDLTASLLMAQYYQSLRPNQIETIYLIGPNHFESGSVDIVIGDKSFAGPFGLLETASTSAQLVQQVNGKINNTIIAADHAIGNHIAFIQYYLPNAKIVPILLKRNIARKDIDRLAEVLNTIQTTNSYVIFSIDFSHYQKNLIAQKNDEITKQAIISKDIDKILKLNSDYLDSPPALALALLLRPTAQVSIMDHTSSSHIYQDDLKPNTTYFSISLHE